MHTMTERKGKSGTIDVKALLAGDEEFLRALVRAALQEVLEVEMTEALGAEKSERTAGRLGYRSGYYGRTLITRIGKLELRVPQDRAGRFSTELFERYQRSERALVAALAEMYVQGVSTRKVKAITEELWRPQFLGLVDQCDQPAPGCEPGAICRPSLGRSVSLSDPGRALRAGA
jgi:putative transposase